MMHLSSMVKSIGNKRITHTKNVFVNLNESDAPPANPTVMNFKNYVCSGEVG